MNLKFYFYDWLGYNQIIFSKINSFFANSFFFSLAHGLSEALGDGNKFFYHLILIGLFLTIYSSRHKQNMKLQFTQALFVMLLSLFIGFYIINFLKSYFSYLRPYCNNKLKIPSIITILYPLNLSECYKSFPSGHSSYITVLILSSWQIMNQSFKIFGLIIIIAVALSRMILARHYPIDVLSGVLIGVMLILITNLLFRAIKLNFLNKKTLTNNS